MSDCDHEDFHADVRVARVTDEDGRVRNFVAEVSVRCTLCGESFHFVGVPAGLSFTKPSVSVTATTLHAPIAPGEGPLAARLRYELPPNEN